MTLLAYGAEQVRALQVALGGEPPKEALDKSRESLERHVREHFTRAHTSRASTLPLLTQAQAPLIEIIKNDPNAIQAVADLRKTVASRKKKKKPTIHPPRAKVEPRLIGGSQFTILGHPFDSPFMAQSGDASAVANIVNGTYSLAMIGDGGSAWASAGVGMWFLSIEENPSQRFAALVEYDYDWSDSSTGGYTAHNDGATNIWIWGAHENAWVVQQGGMSPSWADGTSWYEDHGSGGEQSGTESLQTFFPSLANSWYFAWIWTGGSCDDSSGSIWGFSFAQQSQSMIVPYAVVGSL